MELRPLRKPPTWMRISAWILNVLVVLVTMALIVVFADLMTAVELASERV